MMAPFSSAFLRRDPRAAAFLPADFRDREARAALVQRQAQRALPVSPAVFAELAAQQAVLGDSPARATNLDALRQPGTVVVVSGQQLGLFLGPLYTFYKAATAIQLARTIEREHRVRCVPVFWLQTEDHDFEEIRHCHLPIFSGEHDLDGLTLSLSATPTNESDAGQRIDRGSPDRGSIDHRTLGPEIEARVQELGEALAGLPHAADCLARVSAHYRRGVPISTAFAGVLSALFAEEGLLLINPRRAALSREAAGLYRVAIAQHADLAAALSARGSDLVQAGFAEQVAVRPGSSLFFFHETPTGPRFRLDRQAESDAWLLPQPEGRASRRLSTTELLAALDREPLCFSTSALLRPLLQDLLLPTVAYVGGPGEINYFAQLAPLYRAVAGTLPIQQPVVVPRARFRCLDESSRSLLAKLGLSPSDVERPRADALQRALLHQRPLRDPSEAASHTLDPRVASQALRQSLLADAQARLDALAQSEPGLRDAIVRTRRSIELNVDRLLQRYQRLLRERDGVLCQRIDRLQRMLYPHGEPQERHMSLPYFLARYGLAAFKERVFHSLAEQGCEHTDVRDLILS